MTTCADPSTLLSDLYQVAALAGVPLPQGALSAALLQAPHQPPTALPAKSMAIYVFVWNGSCLKVGKVGPKSQARFTSHHYHPGSSRSNLAKSLVAGQHRIGVAGLTDANVGEWIKTHVERVNFLLDAKYGIPVLNLLETYLQCRLQPVFEGFESQR